MAEKDGGILKGMKDIVVDSAHQFGEDTHRMLGTEKGKKLDAQYKEREERKAQGPDLVDVYEAQKRGKKKGGMIKSASSRGDGCAQRGKTKGRMV